MRIEERMLIMNYHTFELSYTLTASEKDYYTDILFQSNGKTYYDKNSSIQFSTSDNSMTSLFVLSYTILHNC